jgi:predicted outer membrane repeat protein
MEGTDPNTSEIRHAVLGYIEDANVMSLGITGEEIFGGITIRANANFVDCNIVGNTALADGGGVYVADGNCVMTNSLVLYNTSSGIGGGYFASSDTRNTFVESIVVGNLSAANGGGISLSVDSVSSILSSQILTNSAHDTGGGINLAGNLNIADVNLYDNSVTSGKGGAINIELTGDVGISGCHFSTNSASGHGGAINSHGKLQIHDSSFESNTGTWGGAIHVWNEPTGPGLCIDSTFYHNRSIGWNAGGGAFNLADRTSTIFRNCEFVKNEALGTYYGGGAGFCWRQGLPKFEGCLFDGNSSSRGGSLSLFGGGSHFSGCTFRQNSSTGDGGVVYIWRSNISLFTDCNVVESTCNNSGGAFFITGSAEPVFSNVQITNCKAGIYGGAIAIIEAAKPKFTDLEISNCHAVYGGGVYARGSTLSLFQGCLFQENIAYDLTHPPDGGGAFFTENASGWFTRCMFQGNYAQDDGGAVGVAEQAKLDLWNTLLIDNTAIDDGGGVHFTSQSAGTFWNCTLIFNESRGGTGAGIYLENDSTVNIDSSIICQNDPDGIKSDADPNVNYSCTQILWPGPDNRLCNDCCMFDPNTLELLDGSPCIDAGNPDPNMNDACQPPGKGTLRNDMGITGGPENADYLPSEPNLVGWWTFDRIFGIWALESSGRGPYAKVVNGPISVPGRLGRALDFDGIDDYVIVTIDVSENNYTVSLWFKTTSENGGIFSVRAGGSNDRNIYLSSGNMKARLWSNEIISTTGANYADGNWHCVVHTFGGEQGGQKLYVDGKLEASGSKSFSDFDWQTEIRIGYSSDASQHYFMGTLDDVRIYNRSLSQMDVQGLESLR